jgi:hypothetical protein
MNKWKKKFNKVIKELNDYIDWNNSFINHNHLNINPPLIWDIYYEKYNDSTNISKLSNVFMRECSDIIKLDFQKIYKLYLNESFYNDKIEPYIKPIHIKNDIILNMKYELVLHINMIQSIQIQILNYLIC